MRVLIIEEKRWISGKLVNDLRDHGFSVDMAHCGRDGERMSTGGSYDALVINDTVAQPYTQTILSSAQQRERAVVRIDAEEPANVPWLPPSRTGLTVARPVRAKELLDSLRAVRRSGPTLRQTVLRLGNLELDMARHGAVRGNRKIVLTAQDYKLLVLLMRHEGQVLSRTYIAEQVWGINFGRSSNMVDVAVLRLRRKIDTAGEPRLIHTTRGVGYSAELG